MELEKIFEILNKIFLIILVLGSISVGKNIFQWIQSDFHVFHLFNTKSNNSFIIGLLPYVIAIIIGLIRVFDITHTCLYIGGIVMYVALLYNSLNKFK